MGTCDRPEYDKVLLDGSVEELNDFITESGQCLVVDWRENECDMIDQVGELLPDTRLAWETVETGDDIYILYKGQRHKVGLTMSLRDRYITLRLLNEIMRGEFELRVVRHTIGDDTHCFYPKSCAWWAAMERRFPKEIKRVFAPITRTTDFR